MDHTLDNTFESANRVYDKNQLCPTIPTCAGGGIQPKIIEETKCVGGLNNMKWGTQYHQQDRVYKGDIALAQPANCPGGSYKYIVAMRGRNPDRPTDITAGLPTEQRLEMNKEGLVNTLTTVQKDNLVLEQNEFFNQAIKTAEEGNAEPGDIIDAFNKKVIKSGISPTITTRPEGKKTAILPCVEIKQATKEGFIQCKVGGCYDASYPESKTRRGRVQEGGDVTPTITAQGGENINYVETQYRIRKLTPKECWRLMGYTDEDFEKAAFEKKELYIQGDNDKCNARLKAVQEKPKHTDMESFVSCIINDTKSMETLKIIKKLLAEMPENEKTQNVNFVITKSEELEHLECAINTTKCITFMGMQCTLTEGKDQLVMVITEQEKEDKQNTGKFMKITELNSNPLKLYTILILTAQIIKSKIYGSTTLRANIQGNIAITDVCENSILLKISDLRMENTCIRVSSSQLYKQAGNAIVKQVLMAIFSQMNIKGVKPWNGMTSEEKNNLIRKSTSEKNQKKTI